MVGTGVWEQARGGRWKETAGRLHRAYILKEKSHHTKVCLIAQPLALAT
jgi:hypothetical protein